MRGYKKTISATILASSAFLFPVELSNANLASKDSLLSKPEFKKQIQKSLVDSKLIDAIIFTESSGNPNAYNKGAVGLMQLRPIIYDKFCGLTKEKAFDPELNRQCGEKFIAHLLKKYKGDTKKALLHYNNGYKIRNHKYADKVLGNMKG